MRVELNIDELHICLMAIQNMNIQGKDAPLVAKVLDKISKSFDKEVAKQNASGTK